MPYVTEGDLELPILLIPLGYCHLRHGIPLYLTYTELEIESRASGLPGKHSTN